ncbi:RidA family protein [Kordiimonas lacus]|uniref:Enamine deaminase RidA, house cleaning of reactive enamine intermediates, YjgF/YER057c/UK114 family n=1 Tax=Kordiimonas lacus TaxID=637679 RepID=A0A1G6UB67_9PROT|nr:RidA family protein [Kordiimonas lacus]SDD38642.1 Enamine deaminase RidA, house cleaning of reactive enamine intermediates, YjgF/YER057c/UK114 family [Kordiimonas lacus]
MKQVLKTMCLAGLVAGVPGAAMAESARDRADVIVPERWKNTYENWHFAPAVKIDGRIYLSGAVATPIDGDAVAGYHRVWQRIEEILRASGASLDDIVEMTTFHTDLQAQLPDFMAVKDDYIRAPYPAWTAIGITELATPAGIAEVKVVAHVSDVVPAQ